MAKATHKWNRETLIRLHNEGMSDSEIADIFGKQPAQVAVARKTSSYWEIVDVDEVVDVENQTIKTKKKS